MDGQRKRRAVMGGVAGGTCHEVIQQHLQKKREREEGWGDGDRRVEMGSE